MKRSHVHKLLWPSIALLLVLAVVRALLPGWIHRHLNQRIANMGAYRGSMADVELHIWRGSYTISQLRIDKIGAPAKEPFLSAPRTEIAMSYSEMLHGQLRGKVDFYDPTLNFVDGKTESERQTGKGVNWSAKLNILLPAQADEIRVHNGTVTFRNFVSSPRVDLTMNHVEATVTKLSATDHPTNARVATLHATATLLGDAPIETQATFDPANRFGDFHYHIHATHIQLVRANALARAYTGLDFAAGTGDFTMELTARNGELQGYAEPVFQNLQLFSWKKDVEQEKKGPVKLLYEAAAQGVVSLLKGPSKDRLVTRVPISGRIGQGQFGEPQAIFDVVKHAFAQAYKDQLAHLKPAPDPADH